MAFVRVDAPLRQGGAGQSLLVESHRSILCPSWDPCTFVLEPTLTVEEFTSRKLPKWRELTTEEILSTKDRELLKLDRVETGPRYHVWTLSNAASFSALASARDWTGLWDPAEEEVPPDHLKEAEEGCMQREASALLLPLQSPERPLYVTAERGGLITLWDLRHRCAWQSFRMSAEASPRRRSLVSGRGEGSLGLRVAALGPAGGSHFAVAGTLPSGALLFQLFEVRSVGPQRVQQLQLSPVELPWHQWPRWPWEDLQCGARGSRGVRPGQVCACKVGAESESVAGLQQNLAEAVERRRLHGSCGSSLRLCWLTGLDACGHCCGGGQTRSRADAGRHPPKSFFSESVCAAFSPLSCLSLSLALFSPLRESWLSLSVTEMRACGGLGRRLRQGDRLVPRRAAVQVQLDRRGLLPQAEAAASAASAASATGSAAGSRSPKGGGGGAGDGEGQAGDGHEL